MNRKAAQRKRPAKRSGKSAGPAKSAAEKAAATAAVKLDYAKALRAANKGASPATVAKAAGSSAKTRGGLRSSGLDILARLRERGQIIETFNRLGYGVEQFAREVITQAQHAKKVSREFFQGACVDVSEDIDWSARTAAREQFLRATGITGLPHESAPDRTPLSDLSNAEIEAIARAAAAESQVEGLAGGGAARAGGA